ncbi:ankyrin repeat domain-containing protein [Clostridium beijerinckii]|uniref:ankyrin repeat domain-containing protein n=1 Tax=Clostridium beijerinckii TaxID=1520 RepID=UPI0023EA77D5|nr:ankyrin repeat domain-containing protein [Clostridium beijerinckii]
MGSDPEKVNMIIDYSNWLYIAVSEGKIEIVKYLISYGVQMNVRNPRNNPLFRVIYEVYVDIAKLLSEKVIDTKIKYNNPFMRNMDALTLAHKKGQNEIVRLLESKL